MERKLIPAEALSKAIELFWENGYSATSMKMLTDALGVEKPSIYAAFGSKRNLFLSALQQYRADLLVRVRNALERSDSPLQDLDRLVRIMMTSMYLKDMRSGCLIANSALELADRDPEVAGHVSSMLEEMRAAFEVSISKAQQKGEISSSAPAGVLADFLVNAIEGVRVLEKSRPPKSKLEALADFVLRSLGKTQGSTTAERT